MTQEAKQPDFDQDGLYFIPLGGSEQFGVNLNVYISGGQFLAVDCGIGFADEKMPGIDLLLPDPLFLEDNREQLQGIIITHAHEDHVGAVPYLWERLKCPIYTTRFTAAVLRRKFDETKHKDVPIHIVEPLDEVHIGSFAVQFVPVAHSIPDTASLVIETPQGRVLHSGDWNLDPKPVIGASTDPKPFQQAGKKGVLAYIGDSTNAQVPGRAGSESDVEIGLEKEFQTCKGRVAVTMFSSNIGRMISVSRAAQKCGRHVGVIGRSLHRMVGAAIECGFMEDIPKFISEEDMGYLPDDKIVMMVTGSQGEYRAALSKISRGEHQSITLNKNDTVIFSARAIPGNEKNINSVKNNLIAAGVHVVSPEDTDNIIHVSGHPYQDEIADMLGWVKPKVVIPVHGERAQLEAHAKFAQKCQIKNTIIPNNGSVIKLAPGTPEIADHIETGLLAVDQKRIITADHASISDRRKLQYTGAVHISVAMDAKGKIKADPKIELLGLVDDGEEQIEDNLYNEVLDLIEDMTWEERMDDHFVSEELRIGIRRFCFHVLGMKPKTTVHVMRI